MREFLKSAIRKGKVLGAKKWTEGRVDNKTINKTYAKYKQPKLNEEVGNRKSFRRQCN